MHTSIGAPPWAEGSSRRLLAERIGGAAARFDRTTVEPVKTLREPFSMRVFGVYFLAVLAGVMLLTVVSSIDSSAIGGSANVETTCPQSMPLGSVSPGVATIDVATGAGYLLWSAAPVFERFDPKPHQPHAERLIAIVYQDGRWLFDNNNVLSPFTPEPTDCIVALLDFDNDQAFLLEGKQVRFHGIDGGYAIGDLQVIPNVFDGEENKDEWGIAGTNVQR